MNQREKWGLIAIGIVFIGLGSHLFYLAYTLPDQLIAISSRAYYRTWQVSETTRENEIGIISHEYSIRVDIVTDASQFKASLISNRGNFTYEPRSEVSSENHSFTLFGFLFFSLRDFTNTSVDLLVENLDGTTSDFNLTITQLTGRPVGDLFGDIVSIALFFLLVPLLVGVVFLVGRYNEQRPWLLSQNVELKNLMVTYAAGCLLCMASAYVWILRYRSSSYASLFQDNYFLYLLPLGAALVVMFGTSFIQGIGHRTIMGIFLFLTLLVTLIYIDQVTWQWTRYVLPLYYESRPLAVNFFKILGFYPLFITGVTSVYAKIYFEVWRRVKYARTKHYAIRKHAGIINQFLTSAVQELGHPQEKLLEASIEEIRELSPREMDALRLTNNVGEQLSAAVLLDQYPYPPSWEHEEFINYLHKVGYEMILGTIRIYNPRIGTFFLKLVKEEDGFNLREKPYWVPLFCELPVCPLKRTFAVPFNVCLVTKLPGYQTSSKFSTREIEILSVAIFLDDADTTEILSKISEGTINVRHPEICMKCPKIKFIREEGPADMDPRPEIETFGKK